jgi:hypothetical protein
VTVLLPAGLLLVADAAARPALTSKKPPPPPIQLLCAPSLLGAALVSGVCAVPSPSRAGVAGDHIRPLAVNNPGGRDTFKVICGTVPLRLSVLPQREAVIAFGDAPRPGRSCSGSRPPARQGAMVTQACSITWLAPGRGQESAGHGRAGPAIVLEAINNHGVIVGYGTLIYRGGTVQNPSNLIPPGSGSTPGNATTINDSDQIVASGGNSAGQERAFLLTPAKTYGRDDDPSEETNGASDRRARGRRSTRIRAGGN